MAPSNPFDYIGLFNTAHLFDDPVLIIDEHRLYSKKGQVPADSLDYFVAYGKARVVRPGTDLTVLTYLHGVEDCLTAAVEAEEEGVDVEIIDLRTLDYLGLDYETIGASVKKTNAVLIVENNGACAGIGGHLGWRIQEKLFDYLDCPVVRLNASEVPPPVSRPIEQAMIPGLKQIKAAMLKGGRQHF
jgi:2-oxoisovalerate dehydrogenase E1 component